MERILKVYSLPKETDTATLVLDEITKAMVHSIDCLIDIFTLSLPSYKEKDWHYFYI